jgi:ATP-dependent helicase/nuclease subunit A
LQHLASLPQAKSVRSYAEYLKRGNADFAPLPTGDSVRMMTIHASKGLEFPHVLLIDTAKQFSLRELYGKVICDDELGVCLKSFDFDNRKELKTLYTVAASFKLKRKLLEERMRVLYVALTRAKETLSLYATVKENDDFFGGDDFDFEYRDPESKHNFFSWMWNSIIPLEYEKIGSFETISASDCVEVIKDEKEAKIEEAPSLETVKALKDYFAMDEIYAQKYSLERKRVKSSVTAMMEMQGEEENIQYLSGADDDRAIRKGNAYHKAMEIIDFNQDFDAEWERIKGAYDIEALVDKEKLKVAAKKIKELILGKKFYREKQFIFSDGGQLIQGVIDLMVLNGNECVIVDYKTSSVARIDSGAYDLQLSVYAKAASVVLGVKVTSAAVYSFEKGDFAFVSLTE